MVTPANEGLTAPDLSGAVECNKKPRSWLIQLRGVLVDAVSALAYPFFSLDDRPDDPEGLAGELLLLPRLEEGRLTEEPDDFFGAAGRLVLLWGGLAGARGGGVALLVEGGRVPDGVEAGRDWVLVARGGIEEVLRLVPELPEMPEGRFTPS